MKPDPLCPICEDQGWAFVAPAEHAGATVAACLCVEGERRRQAAIGHGRRVKTLAEVWTPVQVAVAFPDGTAGGAAQAARERLAQTGLPPICREWTIATYKAEVVGGDKDLVRFAHWAENWIGTAQAERGDVVLYGSKGTGKTGLAVSMARGAFDLGASMRFVTARDLLLAFREAVRDEAGSEREVDQTYQAPDVLVLDEFGGTTLTEYARHTLLALVDARQKARRSTLITLNVEDRLDAGAVQEQMREVLGVRLADRLVDTSLWWALVGKSRRKLRRTRVRPYEGGADASR